MTKEQDKIITYIQSLLQDGSIEDQLPEDLREIEGVAEIDKALRNLRNAIKSIGDGDLSKQLGGKGYLMGTIKGLQATLKTMIWQTKAIASGDFSSRVEFLGEFSDAFNGMAQKLERTIAEQKELERKLMESEEVHRLLADNASDVIWTMDLSGKFTYVSPSVEKLRGFTVEEVMAQSREELLCPSSLIHMEKGLEDAIYSVQNNLPFEDFRGDVEQPCKDGTTVWTDLTVSGIFDKSNQFVGMLGVSRDMTERKKMEEEIRRLTELDSLTQLYNRLKLDAVLKMEMERYGRSGSPFSVILLDIDDFKKVNDVHGHGIGDAVLVEMAGILKGTIRKIDTAGRWGGEEFIIILPESGMEGGLALAEKLKERINEYNFSGAGHLTASFGVAESEKGLNVQELVARADKAMYQAKKTGKNRVCGDTKLDNVVINQIFPSGGVYQDLPREGEIKKE